MVENSLPPEILSALEDLRTRWSTQVKSAEKDQDSLSASQQELKRQITQQQLSINDLSEERDRYQMEKEELANQADEDRRVLEKTRAQLQAAEQTKKENEQRIQQLQQEHQSLLGKLSHIKETLAPRLEADKQLRHQVTDLTEQLTSTRQSLEQAQYDMMRRDEEASHILSQREQEISQLQHRLEQVQQAYEELQVNAMQNEARRNELEELCEHQEKELETLKQRMQEQAQEHDLERASLSNLQTVLEEFQATKDAEVRAAVEHIERQLDVAKRSWAEYQERARIAESSLEQYQHDVAKTQQYEREIKEKNLLIGKLRHEAIILNEHLIEAMRRLKEESSESNVDRQLITNLIVGFFLAPRGDRKRFEILTIIASVLQMTDEQKEQIGLQRPNKGARSSPSGWTSPQQQQQQQQQATSDTRESFTDAWISFLLKESSAYGRNLDNLTTASAPTSPYQKPTTHNDEQQTQQAQP
ncbi:hypothetical protein BCR43DRAFT_66540 [Syncephalastrum racemosum]|uniref:GRIP domain-containing protein n=1 Tax=Syncephalastrum racemosum TaxID=13706 RepID=A0A1X2HWH4_SYNRA|nr:hypothetical protein BCR43DRAFT_66540 [Syncephalastrum racemosum]